MSNVLMGAAVAVGVLAGGLLVVNGIANKIDGKPLLSNIFPSMGSAQTGNPGYIPGAPRSPQECVQRGGTDLGRGCLGYR